MLALKYKAFRVNNKYFSLFFKSLNQFELKKYPAAQWLDLQQPYDTLIYTQEAFENTYAVNQHLSNIGMIYTAYKLAGYLAAHYQLPDRSKETAWINDFKETDHFVFNQNVVDGIKCTSIVKDIKIGNFHVREMLVKELDKASQVIIKIDNAPELASSIRVMLEIEYNSQRFVTPVDMYPFKEVFPPHHKVYAANLIQGVKVLGIKP